VDLQRLGRHALSHLAAKSFAVAASIENRPPFFFTASFAAAALRVRSSRRRRRGHVGDVEAERLEVAIGRPNALRAFEYATAGLERLRSRCPTACAAMPMRPRRASSSRS
jgi:hypothetical protein